MWAGRYYSSLIVTWHMFKCWFCKFTNWGTLTPQKCTWSDVQDIKQHATWIPASFLAFTSTHQHELSRNKSHYKIPKLKQRVHSVAQSTSLSLQLPSLIPGSPHMHKWNIVLQVMKRWAGPGNEANTYLHFSNALTSSLSAQSIYDDPSGAFPFLLAPCV